MSKRLTSGLVAVIAALSMSIPAVGLADRGGHPHSTKACKVHKHYGKHKGTRGKRKGMDKGKKCGFPTNGQTGAAGPTGGTGPTGPTDETGPSSTHGVNQHSSGQPGHRS